MSKEMLPEIYKTKRKNLQNKTPRLPFAKDNGALLRVNTYLYAEQLVGRGGNYSTYFAMNCGSSSREPLAVMQKLTLCSREMASIPSYNSRSSLMLQSSRRVTPSIKICSMSKLAANIPLMKDRMSCWLCKS